MRLRRRLAWILLILLAAPAAAAGAFAVSLRGAAAEAEAVEVAVSQIVPVELYGEDAVFTFCPEANSVYGVYLFAPDDTAAWLSARLYRANGRELAVGDAAEGAPCAITERLTSGERYRLVVSGVGRATLEIARKTLGRCYDNPIRLDAGGSYAKLIARPGDSHWYAFQAEDSVPATVGIVPEESGGVHLSAVLLDGSGKTLADSAALPEGACAVYGELLEGETYYLRVEANMDETGAYRLQVLYDSRSAVRPERLTLDQEALNLGSGSRRTLRATLEPGDAAGTLLWRSSNSASVVVTNSGEVIAVAPGEATVTVYAFGGLSAACEVSVQGVPMTGAHFNAWEINLRAGGAQALDYGFEPAGAYSRDVAFETADPAVAVVSADGVLTATGEGVTTVRLLVDGGAFTDVATVYVDPAAPRYRALLVAEQLYREGVNKARTGAINTASNLSDMLATFDLDGGSYETEMLLDATREETLEKLRGVFAGAQPQDVSLFYITCHGYDERGMAYLQFCDGSLLSAVDLERELRQIPGTVVVWIDCCGSGGFLGRASSPEDLNRGVIAAFSGRVGPAVLAGSKYKVLTSALLDEDSYRISFDETMTESAMATVFARALADGAGWNISRSRRAAMRADLDMDRGLTLQELYQYTARRVTWYLNLVGGGYRQNVQVWPEGDPFVLFARSAN